MPLAEIIDELYALAHFKAHRAALGGARDFIKEYRNISSHPSRTGREAVEKIRKCREGFVTAIRVSKNLVTILAANGYKVSVHTT